jgi:hypothetical protein
MAAGATPSTMLVQIVGDVVVARERRVNASS